MKFEDSQDGKNNFGKGRLHLCSLVQYMKSSLHSSHTCNVVPHGRLPLPIARIALASCVPPLSIQHTTTGSNTLRQPLALAPAPSRTTPAAPPATEPPPPRRRLLHQRRSLLPLQPPTQEASWLSRESVRLLGLGDRQDKTRLCFGNFKTGFWFVVCGPNSSWHPYPRFCEW